MKFVADGMLGKLTRWLCMLGYDVKYSSILDDAQLMAIAEKEKRILLTRDFELYQHAVSKGLDALYLEGNTEEERLAELAKRFNIRLEIDMKKSRCPKCNSRVKPVAKEEVGDNVEKNTFEHYDEFWKCPKCGQVYWQGAHWLKIRKTLRTAEENLKNFKKR